MPVHRTGQVIEPVGQVQYLRIGIPLAQFLHPAVDVSEMGVHRPDDFAVERHAQVQHAVHGRVLRSEVDDVIVLAVQRPEHRALVAVGPDLHQRYGIHVGQGFVLQRYGVGFGRSVVILAQRIAVPALAQEETAHVAVAREADTEIVMHFAFVHQGDFPYVPHRRNHRPFPVRHDSFEYHHIGRILAASHIVDYAERVAVIHANHIHEEIVTALLQESSRFRQPFGRNVERFASVGLGHRLFGEPTESISHFFPYHTRLRSLRV